MEFYESLFDQGPRLGCTCRDISRFIELSKVTNFGFFAGPY